MMVDDDDGWWSMVFTNHRQHLDFLCWKHSVEYNRRISLDLFY